MSTDTLANLATENRTFAPDPLFAAQANAQPSLYDKADADRLSFWAEQADIFLTYCTNAKAARDENPALAIVAVPTPLAVGANYGLTVLADAKPAATQFAQFVLSADGQRILARHGFDAP